MASTRSGLEPGSEADLPASEADIPLLDLENTGNTKLGIPKAKSAKEPSSEPKKSQRNWLGVFKQSLKPFFRSLGLQLANTLFAWKAHREPRKIALQKSRWMVLVRSSVHVLPITSCAILIIYNFHNVAVEYNTGYSILQFVAKIHEVLMQASISAVLLGYIRLELAERGSAPFGSLFAAAQVSNIGYLWSLEFFGLLNSSLRAGRRAKLIFLTLFSLALAAAVGPSSAILMVPRPIRLHFNTALVQLPSELPLYPTTIDATHGGYGNYALTKEWLYVPGGTITSDLNFRQRKLIGPIGGDADVCVPTNTSSFLLDNISSVINVASKSSSLVAEWKTKMPCVSVACSIPRAYIDLQAGDLSNNSTRLPFQVGPSGEEVQSDLTVSQFMASHKSSNVSDGYVIWQNPPSSLQGKISILAFIALGYGSKTRAMKYEACTVRTSWVPSLVNITYPRLTSSVPNMANGHVMGIDGGLNSPDWKEPIVTIDPRWAVTAISYQLSKQNLYEFTRLWGNRESDVDDLTNQISNPSIRRAIAGLIVTAMATISPSFDYNVGFTKPVSQKVSPFRSHPYSGPAELAEHINLFLLAENGYAVQTIPVILAVVILLLYCAFIITSTIGSLVSGKSSNSWDSVAEITALALASDAPSHLGHISAGIETLNVFKESVSIKANSDGVLELVFESENKYKTYQTIEKGKEY